MKLTLVTPACDRPEAWALCEKYLARQTRKYDQWIVLDDDETPTTCTLGQEYYFWPDCRGKGSMPKKLSRALRDGLVTGDAVVIVENDDYYKPTYLENVERWLQTADLVGEGDALYYNVSNRTWFSHRNFTHASLCSTAFKVNLIPAVLKAATTDCPFVDVRLWANVNSPYRKKVITPLDFPESTRQVVGIKAMPGTKGYGGGHSLGGKAHDKSLREDYKFTKLVGLLGDDAEPYRAFGEPGIPKWVKPTMPVAAPELPPVTAAPLVQIARNGHPLSECDTVHGPNWGRWLAQLKGKPAVGLEVGTGRGESAESLCTRIFTHKEAAYYCIDTFEGSPEYAADVKFTVVEAEARERLKKFPQVTILKGFSNVQLRGFKRDLDFVYVDGGHDSVNVIRDSVLAFDLLKVGGVIVWDDYGWASLPNEIDRPKLAVDFFLKAYSKQLNVIHKSWQVAAVKTS